MAATHDVYLGTSLDDVNNASRSNPMGVLASQGQTATTYDPEGLLEIGQTYYWRIDEVNGAPDYTTFTGEVRRISYDLGNQVPAITSTQATPTSGTAPLDVTFDATANDGDGDFDVLYSNGARSFAIWDASGNLVWDSGDEFEQILANLIPADFNSDNDENFSFDSRSDAKGPEPEGIAVGKVRIDAVLNYQRLVQPVADFLNVPADETKIEVINTTSTWFEVYD